MSQAEEVVKKGTLPQRLDGAADEVSELCKQAWKYLDEDSDASPEARELLRQKAVDHGLHAYRYEEFSDGSVVAVYANTKRGDVKYKAFESMEEAQQWSPREERGSRA